MKKLFYISIILLIAFEILKVYFIMPFPGSQELDSIDFAYFLHQYRWLFRSSLALLSIYSLVKLWTNHRRILPIFLALLAIAITYLFNYKFAAEAMFQNVESLNFSTKDANRLASDRLVLGIEYQGIAKAYPIEYLAYHHQIIDTLAQQRIMVTYCSVCRSGRAYFPIVNDRETEFRLVGMDHFNALFEDKATGTWWRQVNGEAVAGPLKGKKLNPIFTKQMSIAKWFETYPQGMVMNPDRAFTEKYDSLGLFEKGQNKSKLTGRDTSSWKPKSWIIGIELNQYSKAYDWNELVKKRIINDVINQTPIVLALSSDNKTFVAYKRNFKDNHSNLSDSMSLKDDKLMTTGGMYNLAGKSLVNTSTEPLIPIPAYQEFWHSWKEFHPQTGVYKELTK